MQDITPLNPSLMGSLARADETDWIVQGPKSAIKILWTGSESGHWAVLYRWKKGFVAGQHKHLSASHTFILRGKLQVRDGVLNAGDYVYEANGMVHGATTALEDTEYLFICEGPILGFDDERIRGYHGWEQLVRRKRAAEAGKTEAGKTEAAKSAAAK